MRGNRNQRSYLPAAVALLAACAALTGCQRESSSSPADLYQRALSSFRRAQLAQAKTLADQGIQRYRSPWKQRFQLLLVEMLVTQDDTNAASGILQSAEFESLSDPSIQARRALLNGNLLAKRGAYEPAQVLFASAMDAGRRTADTDVITDVLLSRAVVFWRQRKWEQGYASLDQALELATRNADRYRQTAVYLNMGAFSLRRERFDEAVPYLERVLDVPESSDAAILKSAALQNLAVCYSRLGQLEKAIEVHRATVEFQRRAGLNAYLTGSLGEMGNSLYETHRVEESIPWFQQALERARQSHSPGDTALWASNLAQAYASTRKWKEAAQFNSEAMALRAELRDKTGLSFGKLVAAQIAGGQHEAAQAVRLYHEALAENPQANLSWQANAGLAKLYAESKQLSLSSKHYKAALQTIDSTRSELLRSEYKLSFLDSKIQVYRDYVDELVRQGRDHKALAVADATHARTLSERMTEKQLIARKSAGELLAVSTATPRVILCYWLAPTRSFLWVLRGNVLHRFDLPGSAAIEAMVRAHNAYLTERMGDPLHSGFAPSRQLFETLLLPAAALVPAGSQVLLVPDGILHSLNFEALVVPGPKPHYWIEDATVSVAPALHLLSREAKSVPRRLSLLLIGDPNAASPEFPKLRFASAEMEAVRNEFGDGEIRQSSGPRATPAAYEGAQPQKFDVIHFAAHASANQESPLDSAIVLSAENGRSKLYGRDIAERQIRATLVTISACRSASAHTYAGEGAVGFSWAFLRAGAENVIAGIWDVADRSTADLMKSLYEGMLVRGEAPERALRDAKLALLRKDGFVNKPFYWAPFQLYTRVISGSKVQPRQYTNSH